MGVRDRTRLDLLRRCWSKTELSGQVPPDGPPHYSFMLLVPGVGAKGVLSFGLNQEAFSLMVECTEYACRGEGETTT